MLGRHYHIFNPYISSSEENGNPRFQAPLRDYHNIISILATIESLFENVLSLWELGIKLTNRIQKFKKAECHRERLVPYSM
jgi:hypothetical protein